LLSVDFCLLIERPYGAGHLVVVGMLRLREKDRFARLLPSLCMTMLGLTDLYNRYLYNQQSPNQEIDNSSVAEVAHAGEQHGQAQTVGGGDHFGVAL
jgi:hypothetical protein